MKGDSKVTDYESNARLLFALLITFLYPQPFRRNTAVKLAVLKAQLLSL